MKKTLFYYLIALMMPLSISAQFTLSGKVVNQTDGSALEGALLKVKKQGLSTLSDLQGEFRFTHMKTGQYELIVSYLGFEKKVEAITVSKDEYLNIAFASFGLI